MQVNILEAKNRLSELVRTAAAGEEVIIANRGRPVAKLVQVDERASETEPGWREEEVRRLKAILVQMDRIPDRPDAFDALQWDERGLPK